MRTLTLITSFCALTAAGLMFYLWPQQQEINHLELERAEALHVRHGLLSVDEWRERAHMALSQRMAEFEIELQDEESLRRRTETLLYLLIDEAQRVIEDRDDENPIMAGIQAFVQDMVVDFDDLREEVPSISHRLFVETNGLINDSGLREFALGQIDYWLGSDQPRQDGAVRAYFQQHYDCADLTTCGEQLEARILDLRRSQRWAWPAFGLLFLLPVVVYLVTRRNSAEFRLGQWNIRAGVWLASVLLIGGLSFPTIAVDARIESLRFELLDSQLDFGQQVLFYQSKSILEVVGLLLQGGTLDLVIVGLLIAVFSVLFPVGKLFATLLPVRHRRRPWLDFLVYRAGKWSMADVFVLAIFMAFIGLRGMVSGQMRQLSGNGTDLELIATDYTQLGLGFWLFLLFCLTSLFVSSMLKDTERGMSFRPAEV